MTIRYRKRFYCSLAILACLIATAEAGRHKPFELVLKRSLPTWTLFINNEQVGFLAIQPGTLPLTGGQYVRPLTREQWSHLGVHYSRSEPTTFDATTNLPLVTRGEWRAGWISIWLLYIPAFLAVLYTACRLMRSVQRYRQSRRGLCPTCAYDLRQHQTPGSLCPECGRPVAIAPHTTSPTNET